MSPKDLDTDPSTPGAMRGEPRAAAALSDTDPAPPLHSTDPGLGPASVAMLPRPSAPPRPGGAAAPSRPPPPVRAAASRPAPPVAQVAVLPPAAAPPNDSVDILLDGITGVQPERTKTTPQTDGQASASYHAEHVVRPARTSPDNIPSVLVDRPAPPPTLRIDRATLQRAVASAPAAAAATEGESTIVRPPALGPRVLIAIVAGLIVVMALFVVLKLTAGRPASEGESVGDVPATEATTGATSPARTPAAATATSAMPAPAAETSPRPSPALAPPTIAVTALPTAPAAPTAPPPPQAAPAGTNGGAGAAGAARPAGSAHGRSKAGPGGTSDLGEFKTTFH